MGSQTQNGKAFEYACVIALYNALKDKVRIEIEESKQLYTAENFFEKLDESVKIKYLLAANAATKIIFRLEPQLENEKEFIPLYISVQSDAEGIRGDVRDVVCMRKQNQWQLGISCKHNHHAVKHSRLSDKIDFGKEWFDIPCSEDYFDEIIPIFQELREIREKSKENTPILWAEIENKAEHFYKPILNAFLTELNRLSNCHKDVPEKLIRYLLGKHDFYKVITDDSRRTTRVEAYNLSGTLNYPSNSVKSIVKIDKVKLPTRFYHTGFKSESNNTIEVVCDEGWTISMRIHNASSRVEPSLKFDVQLVSTPSNIHTQVEPWDFEDRVINRVKQYNYKIRRNEN